MSVRVMSLVWELDLSASEKLVLLVIADHASDDGDNAWPSLATIARKSSIGERQARRIIRSLEAGGYLVTSWNAGGSVDQRDDRRPNRYKVTITGGSHMSARKPTTGHAGPSRGVAHDLHGGSPTSADTSIEPSIEPSIIAASAAVVSRVTAQTVVQAFVDEFRGTHGTTPPTQSLARIGRDARLMLSRGEYESDVLIRAAQDAARFGHANLASAVTSALADGTRQRRGGPTTANDRVAGLMPLIEGSN